MKSVPIANILIIRVKFEKGAVTDREQFDVGRE